MLPMYRYMISLELGWYLSVQAQDILSMSNMEHCMELQMIHVLLALLPIQVVHMPMHSIELLANMK